ncbi:MAG: threonine--tRNA ligase [Rickettsiales bacterium]|jgi:threonyl-tRNA synthetase|nr:threonine--tRNA ligase [Rickettsiales bacterium]
MVAITLADKSIRNFEKEIDGFILANDISKSLAKIAIAMKVNGEAVDLSYKITKDSQVEIITPNTEEGLEIIRHDSAHIFAQAVKELFSDAQITIGPAIEDGFYYDVARDVAFTPDDLVSLEKRMHEIVKRDQPISREVWDRDEAIKFFKSIGEFYKSEIIESIPAGEKISLYRQGDFIDLCRGPHAPSTGYKKAFKLMKLAGAYWRGDHRNAMLQRVYGTAWANEKQLQEYLVRLEEAEKRDHRKLGKELNLFHIQEEAAGQIFWHDKGWTLYRIVENYIRDKILNNGYTEVKTPILADRTLWEESGHWDKFRENMFTVENGDKSMALKPMNCPLHIQIFKQKLHSYRDLPLRMAEFGCCHRNESSGSMHGLMRVRGMTQDDAHIFCTPEDITSETVSFIKLLKEVYKDFGFTEIAIKFATRPDVYAGDIEVWNNAEKELKSAIETTNLPYTLNPGEGAFYGPKLEFVLKDAIGRDWQCGTLQLDFVLPERLDANYIGRDGAKHRPVMIHRAILGSMERFIGILIEEYSGKFPLWLSPVQVIILTITDDANEYAKSLCKDLKDNNIRAKIDISSDKINYKIRQHSLAKTPIIMVVGKNEMQNNTVSIRKLGTDKQEILQYTQSLSMLKNIINNKTYI